MQSLHANVQAENTVLELGARDRQTDGRILASLNGKERKGRVFIWRLFAPRYILSKLKSVDR